MGAEKDDIDKIETFIRRLNAGEFVFTSKATEVRYVYNRQETDTIVQLRLKYIPLSDCLNNALNDFRCEKQDTTRKRYLASKCQSWIQVAWLNGAIQEGQGLTKKLEECKAENTRMQRELEELSAKYIEKARLLEGFESKYGLNGKNRKN
jgi:hypothetical protein